MMALPVKVRLAFFGGTFLIAMCGLVLQILQTRILSVITWYHLAFFAISMAMFGMTAGSLFVYFRHHLFPPQQLFEKLAQICMAFSLSAVASILLMLST